MILKTGDRRPETGDGSFHTRRISPLLLVGLWSLVSCLWSQGCGYSARPGLPSSMRTVYIKPFINKIDITQLGMNMREFPIYRHGMETDLTNAVIRRYQFTGLLRPASAERADTRLEGELVEFRKDPLRYNASQRVEEWRLNVVVNLRFYDRQNAEPIWEESHFTGDTTYFELGANAESETAALSRAIEDVAKRIVERTVENW